eukprot:8763312-Pyramimonas_sp.AAC.1
MAIMVACAWRACVRRARARRFPEGEERDEWEVAQHVGGTPRCSPGGGPRQDKCPSIGGWMGAVGKTRL